jgi:hypothetical protein
MSTPVRSWDAALAELSERLDAAEAVLELTGAGITAAPLPEFVPPAVDGPLPAALADRAAALVARGEALAARYAEASAKVRAELQRLPRTPKHRDAGVPAARLDVGV